MHAKICHPLSKNVTIYVLAKLALDFKRYLRQAAWITIGQVALITKK